MCQHLPSCPPRQAANNRVARVVVEHWDVTGIVLPIEGGFLTT